VAVNAAHGVGAAIQVDARVLALSVIAGLVERTLHVARAAGCKR
jgi:hypothetical protein